jgi:diguanylate cyclase (GGDEF)-like protein
MSTTTKRIIIAISIFATINLVANLAVILWVGDENFRMVFSDITFPLGNLCATGMLFLSAWRWRRVSTRRFYAWSFLALSYMVYSLGDVIWAILEVGLKQTPYPSAADWFYVSYYPIFLAGILLLPVRRFSRTQWIKSVLDAAIILLVAGMGMWIFIINPTIADATGEPLINIILSVLYPTGDILIMVAILRILYWQQKDQRNTAILLIAASGALTIFVDCIFSLQTLTDTYVSGSILDLGWLASYYLIMLAGMWEVRYAGNVKKGRQRPAAGENQVRWITYFPYIWIMAAYGLLIYSPSHELPIGILSLITWVGLLVGLVLMRQLITLEENTRLTGGLQRALVEGQQQEAALARSNLALGEEIEVRKRIEMQLQHDAFHDPLTSLPNRVLYMDRLMRSLEYAKRHEDYTFSVLFMDLDHFKMINDSLGHPFGDKLLMAVSKQLRGCIRSTDTIARFGGDEFIFLIEDGHGSNEITEIATRILETVSTPFEIDGKEVQVSASLGIVHNDHSYLHAEELVQDADIAMYRAKAQSKGSFKLFKAEMRKQVLNRLELENELRVALEQNEFELYYQPIIKLTSGQISGFEALIRWRHPQRGLVLPGEFIPVAEESGLLNKIGSWVLKEACRQSYEWQMRYPMEPPLAISVNVSSSQIYKPDFADQVIQICNKSGLPGESLKLEITESTYLNSPEETIRLFTQLRTLGIEILIDDFGTGYSSLSYLQRYPVNALKIDQSFISQVSRRNQEGIVTTIISLAHKMGIATIAEGVESREQLECLMDLGCDYAQGFLLDKPLQHSEAEERLKRTTTTGHKQGKSKNIPFPGISEPGE